MNNVSEKGSDFIQDLGDAARKNPLSAALIGMGVLWLFAGSRPVERAGEFARSSGLDRIPDATRDRAEAIRGAAQSSFDAVREKSAGVANSTSEFARGMANPADVFENAPR